MPISTFLSNALLNAQFGKAAYTMPATVYLGLSSTDPSAAGTSITAPTGGGYARVAAGPTVWNAAVNGTVSNNASISFPTATAAWLAGASLPFITIHDAASGGNMLSYATLSTPAVVNNGNILTIPQNGITANLA